MEPIDDQYTKLVPGDEGTINYVDSYGTLHVLWDNGSSLGLIPGLDFYEILEDSQTPPTKRDQKYMIQSEWTIDTAPSPAVDPSPKQDLFYDKKAKVPFPKEPEQLQIQFGGSDIDDNQAFQKVTKDIDEKIKNILAKVGIPVFSEDPELLAEVCNKYGIDPTDVIAIKVENNNSLGIQRITIEKSIPFSIDNISSQIISQQVSKDA